MAKILEKENIDKAQVKSDYLSGMKIKEIADKYNVSLNTLKSWIKRYKWSEEKKKGAPLPKKQGAPLGNKNAVGAGAPVRNNNAEKYGFFSKYLPDETKEIFDAISQANPLDLLWHQIQIAYAAIIRAQKIAYVKNHEDKTVEKIEDKTGNVIGEKWEVQQAWDKQNEFLKAQARAQGELRSLIKQYDEMLHKDWELASEEQKIRIKVIKMKAQLDEKEEMEDDGFLAALNHTAEEDWNDETENEEIGI